MAAKCNDTDGESTDGGGYHTHTCCQDSGHKGSHRCVFCPHTW